MSYRLPVKATLVTFLGVVIMFALGVWQLQRAQEKTQRLDNMHLANAAEVLDLERAKRLGKAALDMPIRIAGKVDVEHYFLIDNRIFKGQVGFDVLLPVETAQGIVMVNLGWVAAPSLRSELPLINLDPKQHEYQGMLAIPSLNPLVTETANFDDHWPKVLQQVDLLIISQLYAKPLLPFIVLADNELDSPYVRNWQPVVMPPEKHLAYAVQWFLLGIAALIIFFIAQRRKLNRRANDDK